MPKTKATLTVHEENNKTIYCIKPGKIGTHYGPKDEYIEVTYGGTELDADKANWFLKTYDGLVSDTPPGGESE